MRDGVMKRKVWSFGRVYYVVLGLLGIIVGGALLVAKITLGVLFLIFGCIVTILMLTMYRS
jgi:hypothetical protein